MSIASEITRLYGVRSDIFTAISNKGVTVPSGSQLDDAPDLIDSISGGGGGGAYTIDYSSPTHSTITGPDCARSGTTITPSITLDTNWVLDNYTLNGSNIQGLSFSMPALDSTVGAVIHEIQPVHFKIYGTSWNQFTMMNLKLNGQTPTILYGTQCNHSNPSPVALSTGDINLICDQYSPFRVNWSEQWTCYIDVAFDITSFDPTTNYITWDVNYSYSTISGLTAIVYIGNTTLATLTYDQPGDGNSHTFRIPEVTTCYGCGNQTLIKLDGYAYCSSCDVNYGYCPDCGELGYHEYDEFGTHRCDACGLDEGSGGEGGDDGIMYCPGCGEEWDGMYCGNCGYEEGGGDEPEPDPGSGED